VVVEERLKEGRKPSILKALFHPPLKFLGCYVWKRGFLDGFPGLVIAVSSAYYVFVKHAKLWERRRVRDGS
jgi:hypothetical protein